MQRSFLSCKKTYQPVLNTDALFVRLKHTGEGFKLQGATTESYQKNSLHKTSVQEYPEAKHLTLPSNIEDIASSEKLQFSPQRNRDISGSFISISSANVEATTQKTTSGNDDRVASYDCSNAVNLSSAMQTNVPDPFKSKGKATHLNMPGGQWGQGEKYMSEDLNNSHPINTRNTRTIQSGGSMFQAKGKRNSNSYLFDRNIERNNNSWLSFLMFQPKNLYSTAKGEKIEVVKEGEKNEIENKGDEKTEISKDANKELTLKQKLQAAVKDYGSVALVFHISISLISLGICFLVVYSGIDLSYFTQKWGNSDGAAAAGVAAQFVVAYAIHKTLAPGRIAVTLGSVPVIVKYLRKKGLIKHPMPKS